jgi:hypothetical protein
MLVTTHFDFCMFGKAKVLLGIVTAAQILDACIVIMKVFFGLVLSLFLSVNSWSVKYKATLED